MMSILGPVAFKLFDGLMALYDRKYGKHGEKVVAKLKRRLARAELEIKQFEEENALLRQQCADQDILIEEARVSVDVWKKQAEYYTNRVNERAAEELRREMEERGEWGPYGSPPDREASEDEASGGPPPGPGGGDAD
jgi:hypothetical protein